MWTIIISLNTSQYKKKMLNIYKNSNKNNNNIISQSKIVLINITLISTIAEWESEYKQ